jgi:HTH-type transcriptional regulator/antitoxin HigA
MISQKAIESKFKEFTRIAAPVLYIKDVEAYENALNMIEHLMESIGDDPTNPENSLVLLLSNAVLHYESKDQEILAFEREALEGDVGIAMVKILIDQYHLNLSDFPEIGHKSLVSKILSGERNLTKNHITKLSKRFSIDPSLFF